MATSAAIPAQRPRTVAPVAPQVLVVEQPQDDKSPGDDLDLGLRAQLIESPNLDRFLRRSQDFLERGDYTGAISVLQDAVEGRVVRDDTAKPPPGDPTAPTEEVDDPFTDEDDPGKAVYSADGRLYRPVLRLCHELLATMPPEGLDLYRTRFEVDAERQLAAAGFDRGALDALARRYFATDAAARAMGLSADLLLDSGRFKAAADVLRTLRNLHPRFRDGDGLAELTSLDVDLEIAVCHRLADEPATTAAMLHEMSLRYAGASVRIMGELVPVTALPAHPLFGGGLPPPDAPSPPVADQATFDDFDTLIPIWQRLFVDSKPYASATSNATRTGFVIVNGGEAGGAIPLARLGEPGNTAVRLGDHLVYMEHNRVRVHDLASGRLLHEGDGALTSYRIDAGQASPRIAVYDYATTRVANDGERLYAVLVPTRRMPGASPVLENRLAAMDAETMEPRWTIGHGGDVDDFRAVTFLATPTVFRDRLLVPVLVRGVYCLQCVDARTGEALFRTPIHSAGTDLVRAPGCHVVVDRDTAFVMTNAGVLAALDAYSGVVRWLRRYERLDPFREHGTVRQPRSRQPRFGVTVTTANSLPGFQYPSEILHWRDRLIFAPTDGRCLLCVDSGSGEVEWLVDMRPGEFDYILGDDGQHVYLAGKRVMCVDLRTGIKLWDDEVREPSQGRGCVADGFLVMPGERCLYLLKTTGSASWQKRDLPRFVQGQEPLSTRPNLIVTGPYVVAVHPGGIEVFGMVNALRAVAAREGEPFERARYLQHAGDLAGAIDVLGEQLDRTDLGADERTRLVREVLPLVQEVALAMAVVQQREPALDLLARCRRWLVATADVETWHLARYEVLLALDDTDAAAAELEALRSVASGR
ncbi:MAG: PQQ-binding-like beta-propeller repeat protein [Planctomycetota bacterium]